MLVLINNFKVSGYKISSGAWCTHETDLWVAAQRIILSAQLLCMTRYSFGLPVLPATHRVKWLFCSIRAFVLLPTEQWLKNVKPLLICARRRLGWTAYKEERRRLNVCDLDVRCLYTSVIFFQLWLVMHISTTRGQSSVKLWHLEHCVLITNYFGLYNT